MKLKKKPNMAWHFGKCIHIFDTLTNDAFGAHRDDHSVNHTAANEPIFQTTSVYSASLTFETADSDPWVTMVTGSLPGFEL